MNSFLIFYVYESFLLLMSSESIVQFVDTDISGMRLNDNNPKSCTDLNFSTIQMFQLCAFVKIGDQGTREKNLEMNGTIFEINDLNTTVSLRYKFYIFTVDDDGVATDYLKRVDYDKWIHICLLKEDADSQVSLWINYSKPKKVSREKPQEKNDLEKKKNHAFDTAEGEIPSYNPDIQITSKEKVCLGNVLFLKIKVAGLRVSPVAVNHRLNDKCIKYFVNESLISFESDWDVDQKFLLSVSQKDLCLDTYIIAHIIDESFYREHEHRCTNLGGRLLDLLEISAFIENINEIGKMMLKKKEIISHEIGTWLPGGNMSAVSLPDMCSFVVIQLSQRNDAGHATYYPQTLPCLLEKEYNLCIIPAYTDFTLYTSLAKYDTNYFLTGTNTSLIWEGEKSSFFEGGVGSWVLRSNIHHEFCNLTKANLPLGRRHCKHSKTNKDVLITLTSCSLNEFTCSDGSCFPISAKCNSTIECSDESDEINCHKLKKKRGYIKKKVPPPISNESVLKIKYFVRMFNIADIDSVKRIAVVDIYIALFWRDPRIVFQDPSIREELDCDEMWTPVIGMQDGHPNGFQVTFNKYRSACFISRDNPNFDTTKQTDFKDPFMGRYIDGKNMEIDYTFSAIVTVPCRFNLRRYPFGIQTCNLCFWVENGYRESQYEFSRTTQYKMSKNKTVHYGGRKDLGEYFLLDIGHKMKSKKRMVCLKIRMQTLFGFHLLNSFTPSLLISLISYSTLFFSVADFNERVMVSLTSLLVLAALFTQASETSVRTPYFKFLDIWFVFMIFYAFLIVIFNVVINKIKDKEKNKIDKLSVTEDEDEEKVESFNSSETVAWEKVVYGYNRIARALFAALLLVFILLYSLGAAEVF